jgi:hypothetical protein
MGYDPEGIEFDAPAPIREGPAAIKIKVKKDKPENSVSEGRVMKITGD